MAFVASNNLLTVNPGNSENFGQFKVVQYRHSNFKFQFKLILLSNDNINSCFEKQFRPLGQKSATT